jgi:transposase-like protein
MDDNVRLCDLLDSEILTRTGVTPMDLPPPDTKRWVARRKAVVVNAVRSGAISLEEVCRRYELSAEEFFAWQRAIDTHGVAGLRVTRLQIYRDTPPARLAKPRY